MIVLGIWLTLSASATLIMWSEKEGPVRIMPRAIQTLLAALPLWVVTAFIAKEMLP